MGVFYRTDKSQFTDFVVKLPENLMLKAIDFYNKGVQSTQQQALNYLQKQYQTFTFAQDELDKYYQEKYGKKFRQILDDIYQNPENWKKYRQELQKLGYELTEDEFRGNIAKYTRPYQEYLIKAKEYADLVKKGKYNEDTFNLWNLYTLTRIKERYEYGQKNPENLTFSNEFGMPETKDATVYLEEQLKNEFGKTGRIVVKDDVTGKFIVRTKSGIEDYVDPNRIFETSMRMLGFVYDDKKKQWQLAELNDVGKYYWQKAYWNKYLELRKDATSPEGIQEAEQKAREYANQYWSSIATNKALAMANQFKSGKTIDEITYRELKESTAKSSAGKAKIDEMIGDLSSTEINIDVIPDEYFNRQNVDDFYSKWLNYFKNEMWKNDINEEDYKTIKAQQIIDNDHSIEHLEEVIDKLYEEGKISYNSYIKIKDNYETFQKYKSSFNASKNYALQNIPNISLNSILKDKYQEKLLPNRSVITSIESIQGIEIVTAGGKIERIGIEELDSKKILDIIDSGGSITIKVEEKTVYVGNKREEISNKVIKLDKNTLENAATGKVTSASLAVVNFIKDYIYKPYNQYRDEWFKNNRDAGRTRVLALDLSSIDGTEKRLSNSLGKRIVSNVDIIEVVDPNNDLQALSDTKDTTTGQYASAVRKVLNSIVDKEGAKTTVTEKEDGKTYKRTITENISNYIQITKIYTVNGEDYAVVKIDTEAAKNLGLSKKEIKALEEKGGIAHLHIPKSMHIEEDIKSYMDLYDIKPIDNGSQKIIEAWSDPLSGVKQQALHIVDRYKERMQLGMEATGSGTIAVPSGDYFEIEQGSSPDKVTIRFANKYGESVYEDIPLSNVQSVIDSYIDYAYLLASRNIAVTKGTINLLVEKLKKHKGDKEKALDELQKIMKEQQKTE